MRSMTTGTVRLDAGKALRFGASAQSTGRLDRLLHLRSAIYRCPRRPTRRRWRHKPQECGECRFNSQ